MSIFDWFKGKKTNGFKSKKTKDFLWMVPSSFVVVDTETTGKQPDKHSIIKIAALRVIKEQSNHKGFYHLVSLPPQKKITKKITEKTGITEDMIKEDGEPIDWVMQEFEKFIGDMRLVIYDAPFVMGFLKIAAFEAGCDAINNPVSCVLDMMRRAFPGLPTYRLESVIKSVGKHFEENAHPALINCDSAVKVYCMAAKELKSSS